MRFFLPLLFLTGSLHAQSSFLKNPDIVWAAEIEQDWIVDIPSMKTEWDSGITTLKLLRTEKNESYWSSPYLADLVFQSALKEDFPIFKDPQCKTPADILNVYPRRDTVLTFDPETYEEVKKVYYVEPQPFYDFKAWRLRQVLAYNAKTANWTTTVESIAPLVTLKNPEGDSIGIRPLFWFRPDDERQNLNSNHIVWAKKTVNRQHQTYIPTDGLNLVKVLDGFQNPIEHQFQVLRTDMKKPFYSSESEKPMSREERLNLMTGTDTIVTYDPETYEAYVTVVHNDLNIDYVSQLRLVQTWYWDERKHRLSICLDAVAPLMNITDNWGNLRYFRPLFYRRTGKK